jgi:hypothetical protein
VDRFYGASIFAAIRGRLIALCRRYGFRPFRYVRQRTTTVTVKAPAQPFDDLVWREFRELHADLTAYLGETTERLITPMSATPIRRQSRWRWGRTRILLAHCAGRHSTETSLPARDFFRWLRRGPSGYGLPHQSGAQRTAGRFTKYGGPG